MLKDKKFDAFALHIHYLLKKDVSSPEEAKQGLRFDTDK